MPEPDPLTFTLTADASRALRQAVADGEFASVDDALADALAAWARRHEEREEELAWIKAQIAVSLIDPGPTLSEKEVDQRLEAFFDAAERRDHEAA